MTASKKTKRPLRRWALRVVIALAFVVVVWMIVGSITQSVTPKITIDVVDELNSEFDSIPEDQRAWPALRAALNELMRSIDTELGDGVARDVTARRGVLNDFAQHVEDLYGSKEPLQPLVGDMGMATWDRARCAAWLDANQAAFAALRAACARESIGWRYNSYEPEDVAFFGGWLQKPTSNMAFLVQLVYLGEMRFVARLLAGDAWVAAASGDAARVVADLRACRELAAVEMSGPFLLDQLVGMSILRLANDALGGILSAHDAMFTDASLAELAQIWSDPRLRATVIDMNGEMLLFRDILQRMYSDDGNGDGLLLLAHMGSANLSAGPSAGLAPNKDLLQLSGLMRTVLSPISALVFPSRKEVRTRLQGVHNAIETASAQPLFAIDWAPVDAAEARAYGTGSGRLAVWRSFPLGFMYSGTKMAVEPSLIRGGSDAMVLAIALVRARHADGHWPIGGNADGFPAPWLESVPLDPYDGNPMRFSLIDGAPVIWSVGVNRTDEFGLEPAKEKNADHKARAYRRPSALDSATSGDWILWRGPSRPAAPTQSP